MASWKRLDDLSESDRHARISFEAVGVWSYLIGSSDSCGRRSGDAEILRRKVFTLRANVTDKWIDDRLEELSSSGLIHLYSVDNRRYLAIHKYGKYNPGAHLKSRPSFPPPSEALCPCLIFHELEEKPPGKWRNYGPVGSGEVPSEGDQEGTGEEKGGFPAITIHDDPLGYLIRVARSCKIIGRPETILSFVEGWLRDLGPGGAGRIEKMLVENQGKMILFIHNRYFPLNGQPKKKSDTCKHGKSLQYGITCRQCDEEKR